MPRRNLRNERKETKGASYSLRIGQLFGPYSVGAIYPCDANTTVMIAGLDAYEDQVEKGRLEEVRDSRLKQYVGVNKLYAPPAGDSSNRGFIPALRFPNWLYCPRCGEMRYASSTNSSTSLRCESCSKKYHHDVRLVPERFVIVCPHGHIDSFPVMKWVHGGTDHDPKNTEHTVYRRTKGGSTTMGDIEYRCSCGARRSLNGASSLGGLDKIDYRCTGRQPWLDRNSNQPCPADNKDLRVIIMGATNVCYPDVASSVLIPDALDEKVKAAVDQQFSFIFEMDSKGMLDMAVSMLAGSTGINPDSIRLAYYQKKNAGNNEQSEVEYLHDEFLTLREPQINKKGEFVGRSLDVSNYTLPFMKKLISRVTLVETLTVTRALVGFTRLNPEYNDSKTMTERRRALSRKKIDWTLANQTIGEGIFIELDGACLKEWAERPEVVTRLQTMQRNLDAARAGRNLAPKELNPNYVVIHTLSHLLLLGISEVCGYTAASLRERIYCQSFLGDGGIEDFEDMHGLLIYTASSSGDGSLGGLVRSGEPGRLEDIILGALRKATWCSDDPVCIESSGQGLDSCNLAACYNCALLPETACENGNKFLDRGLVIGTLDEPQIGLFGNNV